MERNLQYFMVACPFCVKELALRWRPCGLGDLGGGWADSLPVLSTAVTR